VGDGNSKKNHSPDVKKRRKRMKHVNTSTDRDVLNLQDNVSSVMVIFICKFIFYQSLFLLNYNLEILGVICLLS
jgi:hypothetical protein